MRARRPSLTARMAAHLDTLAFVCEMAKGLASDRKGEHDYQSPRGAIAPSLDRYAEEARALVAEHNRRKGAVSR